MIHVVCLNPAIDRTLKLPSLHLNSVSRASEVQEVLGGKGFNIIRAFQSLSPAITYTVHTLLGGHTGDYLQQLMQKEQISYVATPIKENNRSCSILVDEEQHQDHLINEPGPLISEWEYKQFLEQFTASLQQDDIAIFSGSLPPGLPKNAYQTLIELCNNHGVKSILDASGEALTFGVQAEPWLLKINQQEFEDLLQLDHCLSLAPLQQEVLQYDSRSNIIITLGAKGSLAKWENHLYETAIPRVSAVNATASGDIFLGGFISAFTLEENIETALTTASGASLSNCLHWFPHIDPVQVEHFYNDIHTNIIQLGGPIS